MTRKVKKYSDEYKQEAVRLIETSGKPVKEIARDLGVSESALYRWRRQQAKQEPVTEDGWSVVDLEAELKRLRRELAVVEQERDIAPLLAMAQKPIGIFSQEKQ